jgi:hypothetical protein
VERASCGLVFAGGHRVKPSFSRWSAPLGIYVYRLQREREFLLCRRAQCFFEVDFTRVEVTFDDWASSLSLKVSAGATERRLSPGANSSSLLLAFHFGSVNEGARDGLVERRARIKVRRCLHVRFGEGPLGGEDLTDEVVVGRALRLPAGAV